MPYSINQMIVDGDKKVVALNWAYSNADGTLSNQLKLAQPYGNVALAKVDEKLAISWLEDQLQNTAEEFDAAIAKRKADSEYAQTLKPYVKTESGKFEVYEEPLETAPMAAAKK